ncbi:SDR family oxidoreductase [Pseudarthrobacter enclensis]|uniref:NAD(P)-dependent dehydrogenase (Short-subunit alcohol dehydrogenase family) n=1 Tax=Pseudarthrobacter enclensis TaxID=993070 RepID=A0ABT9RY51_9MICC|nr:SDR family oxidoreductase [Pseudarthrobacter enclensis]MDP9889992.1 NAD(P)-dependent dehydrogenase (short-subunit alcohol dehydrogenase family) [Pseudarthrobacter enclensis]
MKERVLVTGGAAGIGAAIVDRCLKEGYEPVVIDRVGSGLRADLSDIEATAVALQQALDAGPIHRLVNNVGMIRVASIETVSPEDLELTWSVNVRSAVQCLQAVLPGMKDRGFGRVVNISSRAALGKEGRTAYASSKAALLGLTRTWALELGKHGVTVNAIGPGPIRTAMFEAANPPGAPGTRAIIDSIPVQRMGEPEDIAHSVLHFLDDRSGFVTGQTLYVCGGKTVGSAGI